MFPGTQEINERFRKGTLVNRGRAANKVLTTEKAKLARNVLSVSQALFLKLFDTSHAQAALAWHITLPESVNTAANTSL